jgi:hypothetical protein
MKRMLFLSAALAAVTLLPHNVLAVPFMDSNASAGNLSDSDVGGPITSAEAIVDPAVSGPRSNQSRTLSDFCER